MAGGVTPALDCEHVGMADLVDDADRTRFLAVMMGEGLRAAFTELMQPPPETLPGGTGLARGLTGAETLSPVWRAPSLETALAGWPGTAAGTGAGALLSVGDGSPRAILLSESPGSAIASVVAETLTSAPEEEAVRVLADAGIELWCAELTPAS